MFETALSHQLSAISGQWAVGSGQLVAALPLPDSYQAIGWIIVALFAIAAGVYYTLAAINEGRKMREGNQPKPRSVTFPPEFADAGDCDARHKKLDAELEAIKADATRRDEANKSSREKLHVQLTRIETDISKLTERSENQSEWLESTSRKLSDVAEGLANLAGRIKN